MNKAAAAAYNFVGAISMDPVYFVQAYCAKYLQHSIAWYECPAVSNDGGLHSLRGYMLFY